MYQHVKERRAESRATSSLDCYAEARKLFSVSKRAPSRYPSISTTKLQRNTHVWKIVESEWRVKNEKWRVRGKKWTPKYEKWTPKAKKWNRKSKKVESKKKRYASD